MSPSNMPVRLGAELLGLLSEKEKAFFRTRINVSFAEFVNILEQRDSVGDVLLVMRTALGLSLRGFSQHLGISHAYVSKLESRNSDPTLLKIFSIADGLNIPRLKFIWLLSKGDQNSYLA